MRKRVILAFMLVFALVAASSCSLIIKDEEVDKQTPIIEVVGKTFTKAVNILGLNDGVTDPRFKVVIHTLRHTFCSWLASQNVPLYTIGKLVGHANLRSTQRYAKLTDDAKWDALKLIEKTAKSIHHTS